MARITIEDCREKIPNRFELVLLATERTRRINAGDTASPSSAATTSVIALKEIAAGNVNIEQLRESFISRLRNNNNNFEVEYEVNNDIDVQLAGDNLIQNQEMHDRICDVSDIDFDNNFDDILLENE